MSREQTMYQTHCTEKKNSHCKYIHSAPYHTTQHPLTSLGVSTATSVPGGACTANTVVSAVVIRDIQGWKTNTLTIRTYL